MSTKVSKKPVALQLLSNVSGAVKGNYDEQTQTWSHRDSITFSPVKHNQEA